MRTGAAGCAVIAAIAGIVAAMGMKAMAQAPTKWIYSGDEATNPFAELIAQGDLIYGVGDDGLIASSPDGVLWSRKETPTLADLEGIYHGGGQFVAFGDSGVVLTSPDGDTWTRRQAPRSVRIRGGAFGNGNHILFDALDQVLHSKDGIAWALQNVKGSYLQQAAYGNGRFVLLSNYTQTLWHSPDGMAWTAQSDRELPEFLSVAWVDSQFVASTDASQLTVSKDGIKWTPVTGPRRLIRRIVRDGSRFLGAGDQGTVYTSADALDWTAIRTGSTESFYTVAPLKGGGLAASGYNYAVSPEGKAWTTRQVGSDMGLKGVAYGNGRYVAVGEWSATYVSGNGGLWLSAAKPANGFFQDVIHADGRFVAVGSSGDVATSTDGDTWTTGAAPTSHDFQDVTHGSAGYIAVGSNYPFPDKSSIWSSADGQAWKAVAENLAGVLSEVEYGNGRYVAVGNGGVITQSSDGVRWSPATPPGTRKNLHSVAYGGGLFVAVGSNGTILTSPDGATWTSRTTDTTFHLHSVIHNGRQFVAIGAPKSLCHSVDGVTWTWGTATVNIGYSIHFGGGRHLMPLGDGTWMSDDAVITSGIRGFADAGAGSRLKVGLSGDVLHLGLPGGFRPAATRIRIRDLSGALILERTLPADPAGGILLEGLAPGMYTLMAQDGAARRAAVFRKPR